ncbi:MAG: hypothetical protein M1457_06075, partial [bacterium]|nr:hypothetical protein [bacterium]
MTNPLLYLLTLEDFYRPTGQTARLEQLLPHLAERFELGWIGRPGGLSPMLAPLFGRRIDLPVSAGAGVAGWFLHPLGPLRLARLTAALERLPTGGGVIYADSVLLAHLAARSPRRLLAAEVNGIIAEELRARGSGRPDLAARLARPLVARWEAAAFRRPDRLIAVSKGVASCIRDRLAAGRTRGVGENCGEVRV